MNTSGRSTPSFMILKRISHIGPSRKFPLMPQTCFVQSPFQGIKQADGLKTALAGYFMLLKCISEVQRGFEDFWKKYGKPKRLLNRQPLIFNNCAGCSYETARCPS